MPEIPAWFTGIAGAFCALFAALVTMEVGFGGDAALLTILAVLFFAVSIKGGEWFRKALVWLASWNQ